MGVHDEQSVETQQLHGNYSGYYYPAEWRSGDMPPGVISSVEPVYTSFDVAFDANPYRYHIKNRPVKNTSNKKERKRTESINTAFSDLRRCIPNVPADTKLSKIKILRLATSYIAYLMDTLNTAEESQPGPETLQESGSYQKEIWRKFNQDEENRKLETGALVGRGKGRGRSGWPQLVWAQEILDNASSSQQ